MATVAEPVNIDAKDKYGRTALMMATHGQHDKMIHLLLSYNAFWDAEDNEARTPLEVASEMQDLEAMKELLDAGADVNHKDAAGHTPLQEMSLHMTQNEKRTLHTKTCKDLLVMRGATAEDDEAEAPAGGESAAEENDAVAC